jgi:hypothetical protein
MTPTARLLPPLPPLSVDQLTENALPDAWKDGQTTAYALSVGISAKMGHPVPWSVLRRAIDTALKSSWIELAPGSDSWPSEMMGAAKVLLRVPKGRDFAERERTEERSYPKGVRYADAAIEPNALQDLMDVLPAILKTAAGVPLAFRLQITLGDGREISPATVEEINKLLEEVGPELRLKG